MIVKALLLSLILVACVRADNPPVSGKTEIIDANHFYSEQKLQNQYVIEGLKQGLPLLVVLKTSDTQKYDNPITLTLKSKQTQKQCKFRSASDVCVLQQLKSTEGKLNIKCEKLPCEAEWKIYQSQIKPLQNNATASNLYKLSKDTKRLSVSIFCQSVAKKESNQRNVIANPFSNTPFQVIQFTKQMIYVVFDQIKEEGYLYFFIHPDYKNCARIKYWQATNLITNGTQINDYLRENVKNTYKIQNFPTQKNFRFDIAFHSSSTHLQKSVSISITGLKNGNRQIIRQSDIQFNKTFKSFDLSYAIAPINTQWTQLQLQLQNTKGLIFVELIQQNSEKLQVQTTEYSYFDLKKGQKLSYQLIPQKNAEQKDTIRVHLSDQQKLNSTLQKCKVRDGCFFNIEAIQDVKGNIYLGSGRGNVKEALVFDFGKQNNFTHKIRQHQSIYIKKTLQKGKPIQVTINSPNVLVYLANTKKCQLPSQGCYQKMGNIHRHFIYTPQTEDQTQVTFLIRALDTCQFTLMILQSQSQKLILTDSSPFVYVFDKQQDKLQFKFIRTQKTDVSFNLIAPVNSLDLIVSNGKKLQDDQQASISTQGYLKFKASDAPKNQFSIMVRKRQQFKDKFVHFTVIASTKGKMLRLESGITHYQTLSEQKGNNVNYIFEFNPDEQFILNFYSHNTKEQQIKINLELSALGQEKDKKPKVDGLVIDRSSDVLDLTEFSKQLCSQVDDDDNCQISISLKNQMDRQIDIAITLMSHHTILQLKEGIWQSFAINSVAKTSHFYFFPRNSKQDVGIMYKTTDSSLRLKYRLFYSSDQLVDISQWPFPSETLQKQVQQAQKKIKPVNHIGISKSKLKSCWPNCVVLISIIDLSHQKSISKGFYSLMATNTIMQIPQKQKIDIVIKAEEQKSYLIDLKYAIDIQQNLYFYIYHSIGLTNIFANVYSQKNDRVPDSEEFDFALNSQSQIVIPIDKIKQILKDQQMEEHNDIYLYIVVQAFVDSKLSIQFAFKQLQSTNDKLISLDSFQHLQLKANDEKIYYILADGQYEIKVARQNGFPIYDSQFCKKQLSQCLEEMRQRKNKGKQILTKVAAYQINPCQEQCFYVFKVSTEHDPGEVLIHVQSLSSQIQLMENKVIYDFTQKQQHNRYVFYAIRGEEIFVNIHITEGQVEAELTDLAKIHQKRTGKNLISFSIPGASSMTQEQKVNNKTITQQQAKELKGLTKIISNIQNFKKNPAIQYQQSQALMSAFGLSDKFIQIHVSIKSSDPESPSIYTITYSSGERQFQLQDGLITDYLLEPKKESTFYYSTRNPTHVYLTVSMQKSSYLKDLDLSLKYCQPIDGIISDECWVQYRTDTPTIKDKTPHPTKVYQLTNKQNLAVTLTYNGDHSQRVSLGINHEEIMILPFDTQFPFILHSNEKVHFLVELSNPGYIQIITRKCDQSNPIFSYTFDYDSFQKQEFTYQSQLGLNPKSRFISKVKPGTLYMQIKNLPQQFSMISVFVRFSQKKITDPQILAGNKGNIQYSIIDSSSAKLTIKPPTCPDSHCPSKFKYFLMSDTNMRDLYSRLVCPSNFFNLQQFNKGTPVNQSQVKPTQNADGTLSIQFKLIDQISYVGIKVTDGKDKQLYYKPLEVATIWGHLSRTSHSHKLSIATIIVCAILSIVICVRRNARRGYKPIEDQI